MGIEITATILGLIQGILVMFNKRSNWIFYALQMIFMLIFSLYNKLYGDVINNTIYIIVGIIGFITWGKSGKDCKITECKLNEKLIYTVIIVIGTITAKNILIATDDPLPYLDAFTTVSSFVATYYMMRHKLDTWIIWFINDIAYCIEYLLLPDQAIYLFILNLIWTGMAVGSFITWRKGIIKDEKSEKGIFCWKIQPIKG